MSKSNLFNTNSIFGYLVVLIMPLSFLRSGDVSGSAYALGHIGFYEIAIFLALPLLFNSQLNI